MKRILDNSEIVSVTMVDGDTGEELELHEKKERSGGVSRCHFYEFSRQCHCFVLRLDWGHIQNGEPVLDANIHVILDPKVYTKTHGKKGKKELTRGKWHHTPIDPQTRLYTFTFASPCDSSLCLTLRLTTKVRVATETEIFLKGA